MKNTNMYHRLLILFIFIFPGHYAQVGVNILNPHPTSALQVNAPPGTFKGLLTPSMTAANRAQISVGSTTPADGLIVYDTDHKMHYSYNSATNTWNSLTPLVLSSPVNSGYSSPSGIITTPVSTVTTFSLGINIPNPSRELDVNGNAGVSGNISVGGSGQMNGNLNLNGHLTVSGFAQNALVPTGAIIMWSGTLIPSGWALCDGGTYSGMTTPDLRGRFIVGMDNTPGSQSGGQFVATSSSGASPANAPADGTTLNYGAIGNKGGETGHTLAVSEMPAHTHSVSASLGSNHVFGFNNSGSIWVGDGTSYGGDQQYATVSVSESAAGGNGKHENRPPYYVLAYIIKLP